MAIYKRSAWGFIKNKIGSVNGQRLRRQNVIRQNPIIYRDRNSILQQKNRLRLVSLYNLYRSLNGATGRYYQYEFQNASEYSSFQKYNKNVPVVNEDLSINYQIDKIMFSHGSIKPVSGIVYVVLPSAVPVIFYDASVDGKYSKASDSLTVIFVDPADMSVIDKLTGIAIRSDGRIALKDSLVEGTLVYMFYSDVSNRFSDSVLYVI